MDNIIDLSQFTHRRELIRSPLHGLPTRRRDIAQLKTARQRRDALFALQSYVERQGMLSQAEAEMTVPMRKRQNIKGWRNLQTLAAPAIIAPTYACFGTTGFIAFATIATLGGVLNVKRQNKKIRACELSIQELASNHLRKSGGRPFATRQFARHLLQQRVARGGRHLAHWIGDIFDCLLHTPLRSAQPAASTTINVQPK